MAAKNPIVYVSMTSFGYYALETLLKNEKKINLIITLPKIKGKKESYHTDFTPLARKYKIPIIKTKDINSLVPHFQKKRPQVVFVNGWSQILKPELLATPLHGSVGTHWALLPKNRGTAAIPWHFINEEKYGGMTLFYLEKGIDSGPIIDQKKFRLNMTDNASTYYKKITEISAELFLKHYDRIIDGTVKARTQNHSRASYLLKRTPRDSFLNFNNKTKYLYNLIRAVYDIYPLTFFHYNGTTYQVGKADLGKVPEYSGRPGQIARVTETELWVLASDRIIILTDIRNKNGLCRNLKEIFRAGAIINEKTK